MQELVDISPEPVEKWQSVGSAQHNILDSFYREPHRYAYTFQSYVFITRMQQVSPLARNLLLPPRAAG
jgi:deoxyadenosine/deoxycytidine kinase